MFLLATGATLYCHMQCHYVNLLLRICGGAALQIPEDVGQLQSLARKFITSARSELQLNITATSTLRISCNITQNTYSYIPRNIDASTCRILSPPNR